MFLKIFGWAAALMEQQPLLRSDTQIQKVADSVEQAGAGVAKLLFSIQFRSVTAQRTTVL